MMTAMGANGGMRAPESVPWRGVPVAKGRDRSRPVATPAGPSQTRTGPEGRRVTDGNRTRDLRDHNAAL